MILLVVTEIGQLLEKRRPMGLRYDVRPNYAFEIAVKMAKCFQLKIVLFHVIPKEQIRFTKDILVEGKVSIPGYSEKEMIERRKEKMLKEFTNLFPNFNKEGLEIETHVKIGNPVEEILDSIKKLKIDYVVMGTHGKTGINLILIGSVAEKIVRHSPVPVTTIKAPA